MTNERANSQNPFSEVVEAQEPDTVKLFVMKEFSQDKGRWPAVVPMFVLAV
jgi:hypothetical protein